MTQIISDMLFQTLEVRIFVLLDILAVMFGVLEVSITVGTQTPRDSALFSYAGSMRAPAAVSIGLLLSDRVLAAFYLLGLHLNSRCFEHLYIFIAFKLMWNKLNVLFSHLVAEPANFYMLFLPLILVFQISSVILKQCFSFSKMCSCL